MLEHSSPHSAMAFPKVHCRRSESHSGQSKASHRTLRPDYTCSFVVIGNKLIPLESMNVCWILFKIYYINNFIDAVKLFTDPYAK